MRAGLPKLFVESVKQCLLYYLTDISLLDSLYVFSQLQSIQKGNADAGGVTVPALYGENTTRRRTKSHGSQVDDAEAACIAQSN